ncbi:PAS domain S-box protein [Lysobacter dokdonensis DS-58]|uniref:histidine kinase n=1 Tax=Lysobacter dokdonensis DS-58 TaxID=1300345 RepID=A0A0A2WG25_9GAMM|nr:PAS domain-containing protein [Lysobacter dokdonensis]KGQ18728.1 PAS domain S-box protein [Lysobacter dokdonensis DS-58]
MVDFEALFRHSPNPYMVVDRDLRYLAVNDAYASIIGTMPEALVGRRVFDAFPGEVDASGQSQSDAVRRSILRVFDTGRADMLALVPYTIERETPTGRVVEERFWSATHTPLFDADGEVDAVLQHTTDVTEVERTRVELEEVRKSQGATPEQLWQGVVSRARAVQDANSALEAQRRHLMSLFDQAPGFMAVISGKDYVFEIANDAYEELVGRSDLIGRKLSDALPEIVEQNYINLLDQVRQTGRRFVGRGMEVRLASTGGELHPRYVDFVFQPIVGDDGKSHAIFVQGHDVTDRESALDALRVSEQRFRTVAEMIPQMVWSTLPDGYHDYYNPQWYAYTGVPEGSTDGEAWNGMFHPDDQARAWERWRHSLATGAPYEIEYRLRHRSGEYRWVLGLALPIRDASGAIVRWMGTCTDINEQKLVQEALSRSEMLLRDADQRKDRFLAILAHELRNPLAPIATAASLLRMAPDDADRVREASAIIERQVQHMTHLVNDLLDVSRVTQGQAALDVREMDLAHAVRQALEQVAPLIARKQHSVRVSLPDGPVRVQGDAARMTQVFANLLNNAAKYTPDHGHIDVRFDVEDNLACIEVEDDGIGMDASLVPRVFDLFVQAEPTPDRNEGGLGIGLALVRSLVQLHGGTIKATSPGLGLGSKFRICLPVEVAVAQRVVAA